MEKIIRLEDKKKEINGNELETGKRTGFVRITQVELGDNFGSMSEFSSRNP